MFKALRWPLIFSFLALLSPQIVQAADDGPQAYVVLVGIDQYKDQQIKPRQFAEADAKGLYDLFLKQSALGVKKENIKLLLGKDDPTRGSQTASKANIIQAAAWLEKVAKKDDLVIFAYFGEGAPVGERSCYFATDSTFKNRDKDSVLALDLESHFDNLKSQRFLALLDVNFLGFDAGKEKAPDPNLGNFYREFTGNEDAKAENPSRVVLLANSGLKPSLNLKDHGIFAQTLIDALKGKADSDGYEPDGNIMVTELVKYLRRELPNLARANGKTDEERAQIPGILDYHTSDFVVDHNPEAFPKSQERITKFDKLAADQKLEKLVAEEGHNLLTKMPKLEAQQSLRKAYQKFADGAIDLGAFNTERKNILDSTMITERDANSFALMVLRAAKAVRQNYFQDTQQPVLVDSAIRGLYKGLGEKIPTPIKDRLDNIKAAKEADLIKILTEVRQHLGKREDLAQGKDVTAALHSMMAKLDKHTGYIDPETLISLQRDIQGHFSGIGVQIRKNNTKDMLQVVTPIINSPAYKAKIYANDMITTIIRDVDSNGKALAEPEVIPTKGMTTEDAVKKILGKEGTKVRLVIEREGEAKPMEFTLIRGKVEVESVMGYKRAQDDDSWNYVVDPENKICYVRLTQFSHNTGRDLENVMRRLSREAGIKGFILDLRFNPGGLLDQAVRISDLFIDDGLIVTIRPRNGPETSYVGKGEGSYVAFPMVCLVNGGSASASEIVSACLQDHHRALIIGSRSYGKGSVQTIHPFDTGGRLKLTTATFWRPSNRNLNKASTGGKDEDEWGVTPDNGFDIKLSGKELADLADFQRDQEIIRGPNYRPTETKPEFRDRQLEMALEYLRTQIKTASKITIRKAG